MGFLYATEEVRQVANRIKGITVEIGGDTTKLQNALKGVNSSTAKGFRKASKRIFRGFTEDCGNASVYTQGTCD